MNTLSVIFVMGLKAGIIGLPNVGKSTIFNALTKSTVPADNYPFCTIEPNIGIVAVPDQRLNKISYVINPKSITPATVEFVDIAGLVRGASKGEGLGNQFLSYIRDVNAIIHVVRSFEDDNIVHVEGNLNSIRDIETIETELLIRDILSVEKRIKKLEKTARIGDKISKEELATLDFIYSKMNEGNLVQAIPLDANQKNHIDILSLLTNKPTLYVANVDEKEISTEQQSADLQKLINFSKKRGNSTILLCGNLESEISTFSNEEKNLFLKEYNINELGPTKLIHASYKLLNLETFFTVRKKNLRAWTIKKGKLAPEAAGEIHTDMEKGFIKAEVYSFDDLMKYKSDSVIKDMGKIRSEGKNYIVKDGDIIFFKFSI